MTCMGRWLRLVLLDELFQLLKDLRGGMTLIGPRPQRSELEVELERIIPDYLVFH